MNTLHLSDNKTVERHLQTSILTNHLNETGKKIQEDTNQANYSRSSFEKRKT